MLAMIYRLGQTYQDGICCTEDTNLIFTEAVDMVTATGLGMDTATSPGCKPKETRMAVVADVVVKVTVLACTGWWFPCVPPSWVSWLPSHTLAWSHPHPLSDSYPSRSCCCHHGHWHDLSLFL
jgi:hypothetical protein